MGKKHIKFLIFLLISVIFMLFPVFAQDEAGTEPVFKNVIIYIIEDSSSNFQIGIMNEDGSAKKVLTGRGNNWAPSVSPGGSYIAFYSDRSGFANLWIMGTDGTGQKQLTFNREDIVNIDLRNRGQIFWIKEKDKEPFEIFFLRKGDIWKIDRTGASPSAITKYHDVKMFRLNPENEKIVFVREKTKRHNGLWEMEISGISRTQIVESEIINPAFDWGDNNVLAFFHNNGICTITYYGVEKKFIKEVFYPDNEIAWSRATADRNNNRIAYIDAAKDGPNIWVMNARGQEAKQITKNGGFSPCWMPDGKSVIYVEGKDIYIQDVETGNSKRLTYYFRSFYPVYTRIKVNERAQK